MDARHPYSEATFRKINGSVYPSVCGAGMYKLIPKRLIRIITRRSVPIFPEYNPASTSARFIPENPGIWNPLMPGNIISTCKVLFLIAFVVIGFIYSPRL